MEWRDSQWLWANQQDPAALIRAVFVRIDILYRRTQTHTAEKWGFGTAPLPLLLFCVMFPNWQIRPSLQRSYHPWGPPSLVCKTYRGRIGGLFSRKQSGRSVKLTTQLYLLPTTTMRGFISPLPSIGRAVHHHLRLHFQLFKLLYLSHTSTATLKPYLKPKAASRSPMWSPSAQHLVSCWHIHCSGRM